MVKNILIDVKRQVHLDGIIPHSRQPWADIGNIANKPSNTSGRPRNPATPHRWLLHPLMSL